MKRSPLARKTPMARTSTLKASTSMPTKKPAAEPKRRTRKCAICREPFEPISMTHKCCGPACALELVRTERAKAEKRERQAGLVKLKRRADWIKEAQTAINAYVRERDADKPCISCGRWHEGQWHAGHYLSTGARPGLRFIEANIHKQCMPCNVHLSGNLINYRIGLIAKIGLLAVEALEADQTVRKYTVEELKGLKAHYVAKLKLLRAGKRDASAQQEIRAA
jgi:hypothetical protein